MRGSVIFAKITKDHKKLITIWDEIALKTWDIHDDGHSKGVFKMHKDSITKVLINKHQNKIISSSKDGSVVIGTLAP